LSDQPTPLWRDPLFSPGDRFPLGPPRGIMDNCQSCVRVAETSASSTRNVGGGHHVLYEQGLTEAGLAHYRVLCKRQRRKNLEAPPRARPHHRDHRDPGRRRLSRKRSPDCRFRLEAPSGRSAFASSLAPVMKVSRT
jgi:hypothetical protein